MRAWTGYILAFCVMFVALQIWPMTESTFSPANPWDILAFAWLCARGIQWDGYAGVTGCEVLTDNWVASALGEIVGEALFVGFILFIYFLIRRRVTRKHAE